MCRWVAYAGPEIYLEDLIFHQEHSIVSQSLAATQSAWVTNGDGFGVAWYNNRTAPGLFKDILPAWNDSNLRSLAAHIQTRLFFAHVRATTGTAVNRSNCHPFTWQNWAFRYSSDDQSPSMYYGTPHTRASQQGQHAITTIASEPSDSDAAHWFKVEERTGVYWTERGLEHFKINV